MVTPGFRDPQWLGTPGDGWGAATVRGLGETVEKETVGSSTRGNEPPPPERRLGLVGVKVKILPAEEPLR